MLGGGPSLRLVDLDRLARERVIATNNAYRLGDWVDVLLWNDNPWWRRHRREIFNEFAGLKITTCAKLAGTAGIKVVALMRAMMGISTDPSYLAWNGSTGGAAINLATLLGAGKIVLLGFDMSPDTECPDCGKRYTDPRIQRCERCRTMLRADHNFHRDHEHADKRVFNPYYRFVRAFPHIKGDLDEMGVEIVNASPLREDGTPYTAVPSIPIVRPEEVLPCAPEECRATTN